MLEDCLLDQWADFGLVLLFHLVLLTLHQLALPWEGKHYLGQINLQKRLSVG